MKVGPGSVSRPAVKVAMIFRDSPSLDHRFSRSDCRRRAEYGYQSNLRRTTVLSVEPVSA